MQNSIQKYIIRNEKELDDIDISLTPGDRVFFVWDLGAGKSTFIRHLLRKYLSDPTLVVRSPTYTYYQKYSKEIVGTKEIGDRGETKENLPPTSSLLPPVYHFDLYRLEDYDTFISIGGEEILQNDDVIVLIEWPEILWDAVQYTKKISIEMMEDGGREVVVDIHKV